MTGAIRVHEVGGPEVMRYEEVEVGRARARPGADSADGDRHELHRRLFPHRAVSGALPSRPGLEGAGVVEAVGRGWTELGRAAGGLRRAADRRLRPGPAAAGEPWSRCPEGISDEKAAAMMLKGMTARYLLRRTYRVQRGETILFHAAAGGVGLIGCQWAGHLGATVIGTVGAPDKAELARAHGCHHRSATTGEPRRAGQGTDRRQGSAGGLQPVGQATFVVSLDCLAPRGLMVSFGNTCGRGPGAGASASSPARMSSMSPGRRS